MNEFPLVSLFCGPGGMDEGFKQAGFVPRLAYDIDSACVETYNHNHQPQSTAQIADLSVLNVDKIIADWVASSSSPPIGLIGGPPCQSFSVGNVYQKETDSRHLLPVHYASILKKLNGRFALDFFVFENVPGLITKRHINKFTKFKRLFREAGFSIFEGLLDAQDFGVAQVRPRVFIIGINKKKYPNVKFVFPEGSAAEIRTVADEISGFPEPLFFKKSIAKCDIPYHENHWCMVPRSSKFRHGFLKAGTAKGRSFRVLHWDAPSYTVAYGHNEVHVHPNCNRRLSVYEAMRLQGFPTDYVLKGTLSDQIRLVSEAVAPPVACVLAKAIKQQLY